MDNFIFSNDNKSQRKIKIRFMADELSIRKIAKKLQEELQIYSKIYPCRDGINFRIYADIPEHSFFQKIL